MKEELFKEAMELARKFRERCEDYESKKESISIECLQDMLLDLAKCAYEFAGFYRALVLAGIFDEEDRREIYGIIYPESDSSTLETGLAPEVINFIKGLKGLDDLGKK